MILDSNRKGRKDLRKVHKVFLPRITQIISNFLFYYPLSQHKHFPLSSPSLRAKSNGARQSVDGYSENEMRLLRSSQRQAGDRKKLFLK